jgi:hypothetical protein
VAAFLLLVPAPLSADARPSGAADGRPERQPDEWGEKRARSRSGRASRREALDLVDHDVRGDDVEAERPNEPSQKSLVAGTVELSPQ